MARISIIAGVLPVVVLGKDFIGSYQHCVPIRGLKERDLFQSQPLTSSEHAT